MVVGRIAARSVVLRSVVARSRAPAGVLRPAAPRRVLLHRAFPEDGGRREERDGKRQYGVDCLIHGFDVDAFPLFCLQSAYNQLHADLYDKLQAFCPAPNMLLSFLLGKRI